MKQRAAIFSIFAILLSAVLGIQSPVRAAEGPWLKTDFAEARLISAAENWQIQDRDAIWRTALEVQLQPGWKIYWRSPGDAGLPTQVFLDEFSKNAWYSSELLFPVPERFTLFGLETYGYGGRVILPLDITVPAGADAFVAGMLDLLACSDICVPMQGALSLGLTSGTGASSIYAQDIAFARAHVPSTATGPDISIADMWVDGDTNQLLVRYDTSDLQLEDIFIEGAGPGYSFSKPISEGGLAQINVSGKVATDLIGVPLVMTIVAGDQYTEITHTPSDDNSLAAQIAGKQVTSLLLSSLLIAFLGGLILNVMPCVLPVLSLKIASVLSMSGASETQVRRRFFASAAGIMFSFLLLAGGLIAVRAAGLQVGWGIQFQQPIFLAIMFGILALFTLSLFDRIYIPIPSFLSGLTRTDGQHNLRGDFFAGMLATLLATPCSAPFVGTAIAFALTASDGVLALTMMAMGLGLASPWLLFVVHPKFVSLLPKPGKWMVWVKQGLGLLLLLTTIWVGSLFINAIGWREVEPKQAGNWQVWSEAEMDAQIAQGNIVFVDVTADWCITCKTNKLLVLDTADGVAATEALQVVRLQADWTRPDPEIASFLAKYGRYGIPFNLILHEKLENPVILPEILTLKALKDSLQIVQSQAGL